jgi:hypothetical protein
MQNGNSIDRSSYSVLGRRRGLGLFPLAQVAHFELHYES